MCISHAMSLGTSDMVGGIGHSQQVWWHKGALRHTCYQFLALLGPGSRNGRTLGAT